DRGGRGLRVALVLCRTAEIGAADFRRWGEGEKRRGGEWLVSLSPCLPFSPSWFASHRCFRSRQTCAGTSDSCTRSRPPHAHPAPRPRSHGPAAVECRGRGVCRRSRSVGLRET